MGSKNIYERFIWFDSKTKNKKYPNATSLASQFEISAKTAQRDIEFMRDRLNCPLIYDKSKKGYCYKDNTFSLPFIYLSDEELSSLLIARKILQDISSGHIGSDLSSVLEKITSILKRHMIEPDIVDVAFSFQLIEYSPVPEGIFKAVLEGCLKRKQLSFAYFSPANEETNIRAVDPYHLFNYMGAWHLIGYCHLRKDLRDFNLVRMSDIKILDRTFILRNNFDFKKYFHSAFGLYKGKSLKQVTLRFSPVKSKWIKGQIWHKDQEEKILKDGSLELSFPVAQYSEIMREILKQGSDVEVIKPQSLRKLIKSEAKEIVKIY